jgi:SAM-dependent methyltransferase
MPLDSTEHALVGHLDLLCCPGCSGNIEQDAQGLVCAECGHQFASEDGVPKLFWPNEWDPSADDVTERMKAFYEETPFPDYDDFDSVGSLIQKARQGRFAKLLDDQVPAGTRIIECGCGTGQLSSFLSIANRTVFGADMCLNSLRLGNNFREQNNLKNVRYLQMNLFRPCFKPGIFDLVISNGVLHHTSDPFGAFESISRLVKPGGYVLIGLYHSYGRLITDFRRMAFNLTGDRLTGLDPNLRDGGFGKAKKRAWFMDQYKNPHESKHTIGETLGWLKKIDFDFVSSVPRSRPFQPFSDDDRLFKREQPGNWLARLMVETGMIFRGSREGGFFVVTAQRPRTRGPGSP